MAVIVAAAIAEAVAQLKNLGTYSANVGEYAAKSLQVLPPILGPEGTAYIAKYVAAHPLTYWGKTQDDYCRKTGCEIGIASLGIGISTYNKEAAGATLAQSYFNLTTQKQYLGRPEADGWRVKAAVYEVFGNKKRAAAAAAKAAQLGGSVVTAAQTTAQAKANAGRPPAAEQGPTKPFLAGWPTQREAPAIGVELSFGAAKRPTPAGGFDFASNGTWGRSFDEKANFALFGLSKPKLAAVNSGLTEELIAQAGNTDAELQRQTWYRIARERLLKAGVPSGQIAAVYGVGPGLPADTQPEPDGLPLTPAGTSPATLAKPSRPLWHYIAAGLVTIVVIGGVIYVVRK